MIDIPANTKPRRRWFQFSLRSLVVLMTLACSGLAGLKKLRFLYLDNTEVSDAGINSISKLTSLVEVYLMDTQFTDQGVKELRKRLPNARIGGPDFPTVNPEIDSWIPILTR